MDEAAQKQGEQKLPGYCTALRPRIATTDCESLRSCSVPPLQLKDHSQEAISWPGKDEEGWFWTSAPCILSSQARHLQLAPSTSWLRREGVPDYRSQTIQYPSDSFMFIFFLEYPEVRKHSVYIYWIHIQAHTLRTRMGEVNAQFLSGGF